MSKDVSAADSRFNSHLSPSTVSSWLVAASKSGLEQQVQLCIDYIVSRDQPLEMDLASLAPAHANQLLTAMQHKLAEYRKSYTEASCKLISAQGEAKIELYTASRSVERLNRELSQKNDEILAANKLKDAIVKHLVPYSKASSSPLTAYTCSIVGSAGLVTAVAASTAAGVSRTSTVIRLLFPCPCEYRLWIC
jgi:hypothetical protein